MTPISILKKFYPSVQVHRKVENETFHLLNETLDEKYVGSLKNGFHPLKYIQRNFFSILFLAIYRALGISGERCIFYGVVNHSIRGIVTGTDNLLDDEYKEMLPLRFSAKATRFKSVMHILLFDRFLFNITDRAAEKGVFLKKDRETIHQMLFRAMIPIGEEEASEEGGVNTILPPEEILSSVHTHKGGNLLRLALVVPRFVEKDLAVPLEVVDRGIYHIGVALQMIDDLTDFYEDIQDQRHNYLLSFIFFKGTEPEKEKLNSLIDGHVTDTAPIEKAYAVSVARVMEHAIDKALTGFDLLSVAGFWLNRQSAKALIHYLFYLRGVKNLLALIPKNGSSLPMRSGHGK